MYSLAYVLAVSLRELFPDVEIFQINATLSCFFCDIRFPGEFSSTVMNFLEERMRVWVAKKEAFQVLEMVPSNAAQFLEHHGEKRLAKALRSEKDLVALLKLDRFFFRLETEAPQTTADTLFFKLACFWPLKKGIRILGAGAPSKEELKKLVQHLKAQKNLQEKLEALKAVSWIQDQLVWEPRGEFLKDLLRKKIMTLYQEFDRVSIATKDELKNVLPDWVRQRKRSVYQVEMKTLPNPSLEPWDSPWVSADKSWGKIEEITSFLHLATKFLTMLTFDYKVVSVGKTSAKIKKTLDDCAPSWSLQKGAPSRIEFRVVDSLGQEWTLSTVEWDEKRGVVQMSLCLSFERCIALLVDRLEIGRIETLLGRLN